MSDLKTSRVYSNPKDWTTRFGGNNDLYKISQFRNIFQNTSKDSKKRSINPDYYYWKLLSNPFQKGILTIAEHENSVVSFTTITPKRILVGGKLSFGAEIGDTFTHQKYQRRGIFATLVEITTKKALEEGLTTIYGTPNTISLAGYEKKCNFARIQSVDLINLVYPINKARILKNRFHIGPFAIALGAIAELTYRMLYSVGESVTSCEIEFFTVSEFPDDIELLSQNVSMNYSWILERSKKYLDWRFVKNPDKYSIIIAKDRENIVGYLVTKQGLWRGLKVGYIADFLCIKEHPKIFLKLLLHTLSLFAQEGADMVAAWVVKETEYYKTLRQLGFQYMESKPIIVYLNEQGKELVARKGKWHFTMADSDNI